MALDLLVLKVEMSFSTFIPPHLGHFISEVRVPKRTSFSNFSPHSKHRYSYIGILHHPLNPRLSPGIHLLSYLTFISPAEGKHWKG